LIGMVERETEICVIVALEEFTTELLKETVKKWIVPGSILISDQVTYADGLAELDFTIFVTESYVARMGIVNGQRLNVNNALLQSICDEARTKFSAMNGFTPPARHRAADMTLSRTQRLARATICTASSAPHRQ
uniref:DDE_Tnp_IS1595 domain-containing protein n=1 Tax=Gongylonema pulchrum TaxID=637853 RepID=A0A183DDV4_9BILA